MLKHKRKIDIFVRHRKRRNNGVIGFTWKFWTAYRELRPQFLPQHHSGISCRVCSYTGFPLGPFFFGAFSDLSILSFVVADTPSRLMDPSLSALLFFEASSRLPPLAILVFDTFWDVELFGFAMAWILFSWWTNEKWMYNFRDQMCRWGGENPSKEKDAMLLR